MPLILQDSSTEVLYAVSVVAGQIVLTPVAEGTPATINVNDASGDSFNVGIISGQLDTESISNGAYPTVIPVDPVNFLIVNASGDISIGSLYSPSLAVDSVIEALGAFIQPFVGAAQIIRAQVNRVAPPIGSFVELTEILQADLEYPRNSYDSLYQQRKIIGPKRIMIQADFYGKESGDWCSTVKTVFRTAYAAGQFPSGIAPLYTDDAHEAPLMTGEQQYERRWVLTLNLQFNPMVIVPQQSANVLKMNLVEDVQEITL